MTDQAAEQTTTGGISDRIVFLVLGSLLTLAIIVSLIAFFDFGRWWVFGNPNFAPWLDGFFQNAGTEFLGALLTFYLIETLLRKRRAEDERKDREQLQARLDEDEERRTEELKALQREVADNFQELQREVAKEIRDELRSYIQAQELARLRVAGTAKDKQPIIDSMKATKLLSGVQFQYFNLRDVVIENANMENADLSYATFENCKLGRSNLSGAELTRADFYNADLSKVDLRNANLLETRLESTRLEQSNMLGALLVTTEQLEQAASLSGTVLPDGVILPNDGTWKDAFLLWLQHVEVDRTDNLLTTKTFIVPVQTEDNIALWLKYYGSDSWIS